MSRVNGLEDEIKQVIFIRTDLEMGMGKMVAQGAHASLESLLVAEKRDKQMVEAWRRGGQKKIVLKSPDLETIEKLYKAFEYKGIPCALITDMGLTQLPPNTKTALGIGPWRSSEIDMFTKAFKLL